MLTWPGPIHARSKFTLTGPGDPPGIERGTSSSAAILERRDLEAIPEPDGASDGPADVPGQGLN